jgi:uncharacterized protein (DUF58 family)
VVAVVSATATVAALPAVRVARTAEPAEVERGAMAVVTHEFRIVPRRRSRPFTVIETVDGELRTAVMPAIESGATVPLRYGLDTSRRGYVVTGPLTLRRSDRFGLVCADRRISGTCAVAVRPRRHAVRALPSGRLRDLEGPTREISEGSASFHQLRHYVPGDDLRRIHWRTTARTGTLTVRQLVDTSRPELVLIVDNRRSAVAPDDFEQVVEVAASLLHAAERDGFPTQVLFTGRAEHGPRTDAMPALDRLTAVSVTGDGSLLELAEALRARGRSLVLVTGELSASDLALVGRITRRFSPAYLVSVVAGRTTPFVAPPGVQAVVCASAEEFVARWQAVR